jgi:4-alpha-glucanotransferase
MPRLPRGCGVLLHPTSLPGRFGIGDLGPAAYRFLGFLAETGQRWWQMLPLGPVGYGGSPYQSPSSFAGNWMLISPELLLADGLVPASALADYPALPAARVDFEAVATAKLPVLKTACANLADDDPGFVAFRAAQVDWLEDYALFMALKVEHGGKPWTEWEADVLQRRPAALKRWRTRLRDAITFSMKVEYLFDRQWRALRELARVHGIGIIGDVPIYTAHDSVDVWTRRELFRLDARGLPTHTGGAPPDSFKADGQNWGTPIYDWPAHRAEGYRWWIQRMRRLLDRVDLIRLDHFRGFQAYWEIPASAESAADGYWKDGPDHDPDAAPFLNTLRQGLGGLPLIAEDLGYIDEPVHRLRDNQEIPGMKVLQFAFDGDWNQGYLPHTYPSSSVAYTGTHDTPTIAGWFHAEGPGRGCGHEAKVRERQRVRAYLGTDGTRIHWDAIRAVLFAPSDTAILPMQDVLGLGPEARMNVPGETIPANWSWRYRAAQLDTATTAELARLTLCSGRWSGWQSPPEVY